MFGCFREVREGGGAGGEGFLSFADTDTSVPPGVCRDSSFEPDSVNVTKGELLFSVGVAVDSPSASAEYAGEGGGWRSIWWFYSLRTGD